MLDNMLIIRMGPCQLKISCLLLQYACCYKFDLHEHTAHILCHYTRSTLEELCEQLGNFAESNIKWIQSVGADRLAKLDMDATTYMKGIMQGTLKYDSLTIAVTCAAFNIHVIIMLAGTLCDHQGQ